LLVQMQSNGTLRDFVINNSSYMKLREMSLSYDMPERLSSRFGAHGVVLTASGRNLHTWSPYTGLDPEMMFLSGANPGSNFGVDQAEYPPLTSFVFTVKVNY
jgi:TonB-dependent starch-binding outer membrane protein SusC